MDGQFTGQAALWVIMCLFLSVGTTRGARGLAASYAPFAKGVIPLTDPAEPADAEVTAVLETLALEHVSGVLEIDGSPTGTVYFDQGQITFARASWTPDLSARLRGALRPAGKLSDLLDRGDRPDFDLGDILIRQGLITREGLQEILRSVVVDTLIALTAPPLDRASVSDIRFQAPGSHWAGTFCQLDVACVAAEAATWADRISRYGVARSTPVALRDLDLTCAVLKREQWDIAATLHQPLSAQELAWQHGLALYDVIERVGGLVQSGLCMLRDHPLASPVPAAGTMLPRRNPARTARPPHIPRPAEPGSSADPQSAEPQPGVPQAGVPQPGVPQAGGVPRPAGARLPGGTHRPGGNGSGHTLTPAAPELLRRVLDGLKELS